jgi:hypothetical protein
MAPMNRTINAFLLLVFLLGGLSASATALASEWGCQVMLCLSDKRGPMTEEKCRPPIDMLYDRLRNGGSMPTCDESNGYNVKRVVNPYDMCPQGLAETSGWVASATDKNRPWKASGASQRPNEDGSTTYGVLACVGTQVETYQVAEACADAGGGGDAGTTWNCTPAHTVRVFDQVMPLPPQSSTRAIELYNSGGQLQQRLHY